MRKLCAARRSSSRSLAGLAWAAHGLWLRGGLRGAPRLCEIVRMRAITTSAVGCGGRNYSLPGRTSSQSFTYAVEGRPDLWELPGHGWHENLLKEQQPHLRAWASLRVLLFPPLYPEAIPTGFISTPEEEFRYNNRPLIRRARKEAMGYVSMVWHPWSLALLRPGDAYAGDDLRLRARTGAGSDNLRQVERAIAAFEYLDRRRQSTS